MQRRWIPALFMIVLLIAFRVVGNVFPSALPNFQPLCALFLCSIACQRGAWAWGVPLAAWVVSNPLASWLNHSNPFTLSGGVAIALATLIAIGGLSAFFLRRRASSGLALLAGSLAAAILFHVVTNAAVWLADPTYAKSAQGLVEALWSGRPSDVLPTWVFFRNLAVANVLFTGLFLLARRTSFSSEAAPLPLSHAQPVRLSK